MSSFNIPDIEYYQHAKANTENVFSIIIPSWNNLPYLKLCIESVLKNSTYKHQIIIHVNQGEDGTLEWAKNSGYDFTYSKTNAGVCYAVNAMATLATTDYILFLNDDMYVCPQWDEALFNAAKQSENNMFYYSGTMIEPTDTGNPCVLSPHNFGSTIETFKEQELINFAKQTTFNNWSGACWPPSLVHKKNWQKVGGYSIEFSPGFYSDPDFAMKLWKLGIRDFKGIGSSLVYHFQCKSTGRAVKNDGRKTFAQKWGVPSSYFYKKVLKMGKPVLSNKPLTMQKDFNWVMAKIRAFFIGL